MSLRPVKRLIMSKPALEGAGVHLRRAFGFGNTSVTLSLMYLQVMNTPEQLRQAFNDLERETFLQKDAQK
jgi:hypothetical protein